MLRSTMISGRGTTAPASSDTLQALLQVAAQRDSSEPSRKMTIMPGSGVNSKTIRSLLEALLPYGLKEVHLSGGRWIEGNMMHRRPDMGMGVGEEVGWSIWRTDEEEIRRVRRISDEVWREARNKKV